MNVYLVFTDGDHYDFAVTRLGAFTSREAAERAAKHESLDPDHVWENDLAEYRAQLSYYESRVPYYRNHFVEDALGLLDKVATSLGPDQSLADGIEILRYGCKDGDLRHGLLVDALVKTLNVYNDVHFHYMTKPNPTAKWLDCTGLPDFTRSKTGMGRFRDILKTMASRILRDELLRHRPEAPNPLIYRPDPFDGKLHRRTGCRYWVEEIEVDKEATR